MRLFSGIDRADPPAAIINFTNDAWYGVSDPHQHLRIPVYVRWRVTAYPRSYTGISGAVDAYGRVLGTIP